MTNLMSGRQAEVDGTDAGPSDTSPQLVRTSDDDVTQPEGSSSHLPSTPPDSSQVPYTAAGDESFSPMSPDLGLSRDNPSMREETFSPMHPDLLINRDNPTLQELYWNTSATDIYYLELAGEWHPGVCSSSSIKVPLLGCNEECIIIITKLVACNHDNTFIDHIIFHRVHYERDVHGDMHFDVDSMSYQELLALEEEIGSVSTGLTEEVIVANAARQNHHSMILVSPDCNCCICQEEHEDGDDIGKLGCGHGFHYDCIRQWLMQKNSCAVCRLTAVVASE